MKRVAINGLGRIGGLILRQYAMDPPEGIEIVAANDLIPVGELAYLLHYDSVHGRTPFPVSSGEGFIMVGTKKVTITHMKDPKELPWKDLDIDIVLECTGLFRGREDAQKHRDAGAKKVIISAPTESADLTIVLGVNESQYDPKKHHIISNASCTTNSLAPALKVLNDAFGLDYAMVTTVHAYTSSQALVDKATASLKRTRGRAAALSLVPTSTGAGKATELVLPELKGRMDAIAIRAPIPDGAITDIVASLGRDVTIDEVNAAFRKAADGPLKGILGYNDEQIVSADIIGDTHSGIIDAPSTKVIMGRVVKVFVWYDNEYGYSRRMLDLSGHIAKRM